MSNETSIFGCTEAELVESLKINMHFYQMYRESKVMLATSMLSDVQELMAHGMTEDARQLINRVKYLLTTFDN